MSGERATWGSLKERCDVPKPWMTCRFADRSTVAVAERAVGAAATATASAVASDAMGRALRRMAAL
ncbi:MAG TPA: hypothetical protein VFA56_11050 [Gaiellaceae bacterium]|nr:hypothetical protein [Gaiellaceae bacterium]